MHHHPTWSEDTTSNNCEQQKEEWVRLDRFGVVDESEIQNYIKVTLTCSLATIRSLFFASFLLLLQPSFLPLPFQYSFRNDVCLLSIHLFIDQLDCSRLTFLKTMDAINTNMNIFDSPPVAKHNATRFPPFPSYHYGGVSLDDDGGGGDGGDDAGNAVDQEEDEIYYTEDTTYQDTVQEAVKWISTLNNPRDELYKLQIQAATILDNFSMLAPDLDLMIEKETDEEMHDMEMSIMMPNSLVEAFDKSETTDSRDDNIDTHMHDEDVKQNSA